MHCVPDAELALQEVFRVLKPEGRLYATTFLRPFPDIVFRFFTVDELDGLVRQAGFRGATSGGSGSASNSSSNLQVASRGVYGTIKAIK